MYRVPVAVIQVCGTLCSLFLGFLVGTESRTTLVLLFVGILGFVVWEPALAVPVSFAASSLYSYGSPTHLSLALLLIGIVALGSIFTAPSAPLRMRTHLFGLFLLVILCSQLIVFSFSMHVAARVAAVVAGAALALTVYLRGHANIDRVRRAFIATTVLVSLQAGLGIVQALSKQLLPSGYPFSSETLDAVTDLPGLFRGVGTFAHPNALGIVLVLMLPVAIWLLQGSSGLHRAIWSVAISLIVVAALATLSRSAVLALFAVGAMLVLGLRRVGRSRRVLYVFTVSTLMIPGLFVGPFARFGVDVAVANRDSGSNEARLANMRASALAWQEQPWFGHGLGSGPLLSYRFGGYRELGAHNTYLDVLAGGGVVLAVALTLGAYLYWIPAMRFLRKDRNALFAVPVAVGVLGMFESLFQSGFVVLIGALTGLMALQGKLARLPGVMPVNERL